MSSFMTKLEFLPKPIMIRIGNLPLICCLLSIEFSQALLMPFERFVMLLKSRSRTHHPHMHYSYTGRRRTHFFIQIHLKVFCSYTESKHQKIYHIGQPQINAQSFCYYLSKVLLQKDACGYAKVLKKRREEKKWTSVQESKIMGTLMPA